MSSHQCNRWDVHGWRDFPIQQQPHYKNEIGCEAVERYISTLPAVVGVEDVCLLIDEISKIQKGEGFFLQGGDCAERFMDCHEEFVFGQLDLLTKLGKIIEATMFSDATIVARIAGQYAKPRSNENEIIDGVALPSYRGDMINQLDATLHARTPDPQRIMLAYKHSVKTMFFMKKYLDLSLIHI